MLAWIMDRAPERWKSGGSLTDQAERLGERKTRLSARGATGGLGLLPGAAAPRTQAIR
jgi:hypothetical protein